MQLRIIGPAPLRAGVMPATPMICERCKKQEATCEFRHGNQPPHARTWHLCQSCLQHFAPGFPTAGQIQQKSKETGRVTGDLERDGFSCGWASFSPEELIQNDDKNKDPSAT
jgi:hypothetical protein